MLGRNDGRSSTESVELEKFHLYSAYELAKRLKVSKQSVKACLTPCKKLPSALRFVETKAAFYDGKLILTAAVGGSRPAFVKKKDWLTACEKLAEMQVFTADPSKNSTEQRAWEKTGCLVRWIEYSGSRRNLQEIHREQDGCIVEYTGRSNYLVTLPDGQKIVRREGTYGFEVIGGTEVAPITRSCN